MTSVCEDWFNWSSRALRSTEPSMVWVSRVECVWWGRCVMYNVDVCVCEERMHIHVCMYGKEVCTCV